MMLRDLLAPVTPEDFLRNGYGRKPMHISGSFGKLSGLFSWGTLNQLLSEQRLGAQQLRLVRAGQQRAVRSRAACVESGRRPREHLDWPWLLQQLRQGCTLKLDDVDQVCEPITALCRKLELELSERVHANIYVGWFEQPGFETHWDDHDVLIAQISGRKHWRIFAPTRAFPIAADKQRSLEPPAAQPCWQADLQPGDVLHIPRGWWHDAAPLGEPTLHVTIGIYRQTGMDLAKALVAGLAKHELLRADLPRFSTPEQQGEYLAAFRRIVHAAVDSISLESHFRDVDATAPARLRAGLPWSVMPDHAQLAQDTWVHWLTPRSVAIEDDCDEVTFEAMGSRFRFSAVVAPILADLASLRSVSLAALHARHEWVQASELRRFVTQLAVAQRVTFSAGP